MLYIYNYIYKYIYKYLFIFTPEYNYIYNYLFIFTPEYNYKVYTSIFLIGTNEYIINNIANERTNVINVS